MVTYFINHYCLIAQQVSPTDKLPPTTRNILYMALLGILILGLLLVVIVLLGGHWVRKLGSYRRGPAVPNDFIVQKDENSIENRQTNTKSVEDLSCTETISQDDTIVSKE